MRVAVTGATGFIGAAVGRALERRGDDVVRWVRPTTTPPSGTVVRWDPVRGVVNEDDLRRAGHVDAVIHLAGAGIADRRWSPAYRHDILTSRTLSTSLLATTLLALPSKVDVVVSGSAIGYYGNGGEHVLTEDAPPGHDFLADVCAQWEAATRPLRDAGIAVAHLRTGIVLGRGGGVMKKVTPLFRAGLGGRLGTGRQWMSPISLRDEVSAILFLLDERRDGEFNAVAPTPCTNRSFTAALARALHRPALAPAPSWALRRALGSEMADNTLLTSQRVVPHALQEAGFEFRDADVEACVSAALT